MSSSFTPRTNPRPQYPPLAKILSQWMYVHARDMVLGCGLVAGHTLPYVLFNGTLLLCEQLGWLIQYKMPRKRSEEPTKALYQQLLIEGSISNLIVSPIVALGAYDLARYVGMPLTSEPIKQSWIIVALTFMAAHSFNDWAFYWCHRTLHMRSLYARFHKQHHAFRGSVGAAAEFAGPVEQVLANQIPTVGLMLITGQHALMQAVWLTLRLTQTYEVHSGYHFRDSWAGRMGLTANGASFHDHHHTENTGNFGAEHMDWLFGTMDHYLTMGGEEGYLKRRYDILKQKEEADGKKGG